MILSDIPWICCGNPEKWRKRGWRSSNSKQQVQNTSTSKPLGVTGGYKRLTERAELFAMKVNTIEIFRISEKIPSTSEGATRKNLQTSATGLPLSLRQIGSSS